ncbi:MAG: SRPBCC family protein [Rhodospirillaceae bacterium]|nr:SRPBCC family protein [Rhodospirillaceae bacterium]
MGAERKTEAAQPHHATLVERASDRELIVTRTFNAPVHLVFQAWTTPDLLKQWWVPKSYGIYFISCEADVRPGGTYRFVFGHPSSDQPMEFVGKYIEVIPGQRLVWTNEESADGAVTTVTFDEKAGKTIVVLRDLYPSKEALDAAIASGSTGGMPEQCAQLDVLLASFF